jgi:predicted dehydrogenase
MESIRIAQVGVGYWGKNLLRNFSSLPGVEVAMVCDARESVLGMIGRSYPGIPRTLNFEDVLSAPDVDAIVVATETVSHFDMTRAALLSGKHVFVEKPMTRSVAEAEELVQIADRDGLTLMVGHLLLYHPAYSYVHDVVRRGDLGSVYYLYGVRANLGIIRQRENVLESLAPHDIAVALHLIESEPVEVAARGMAYLQKGIEDVTFTSILFAGDELAHFHSSWLDPNKVRRLTVVGSSKMAVIDDLKGTEKVRLYDKGVDVQPGQERYADYAESLSIRSGDIHIPSVPPSEPLRLECQHFVDCLRSGDRPVSDGRNGLSVMRVLEAAQESLRQSGMPVRL